MGLLDKVNFPQILFNCSQISHLRTVNSYYICTEQLVLKVYKPFYKENNAYKKGIYSIFEKDIINSNASFYCTTTKSKQSSLTIK